VHEVLRMVRIVRMCGCVGVWVCGCVGVCVGGCVNDREGGGEGERLLVRGGGVEW
jgi:hypothetical protein